ncbi:MAG TPA: GGDEF domain-containing protein [Nitrospiria bacterium]|nr:GGDEF domain-containing protein [Nitrospiria bacterium]
MPKTHTAGLSLPYYFLYGTAALPWLTDVLVQSPSPADPSGIFTKIGLSAVLGGMVFFILRFRKKTLLLENLLEQRARTDELSTLGNAQSLEEALVREIARSRRWSRPLSFIFFDLDDYKAINDRFGHTTGNSVIHAVGRTTRSVIRLNIDMAFRYGGDEFIIILPETNKARAYIIAQRLHDALSELHPPEIPVKSLRACLGFTELREDQNARDLLNHLDNSMRRVKGKKKNTIFDADEIDVNPDL